MSLYNKYRPLTFDEVIGQDHIVSVIKAGLKQGKYANAYLFYGTHGVGKTTIARILARALNCDNIKDGNPCNKCNSCLTSINGNHPDIIEIDGATSGGVDNVKKLRETAYRSVFKKKRVVIIDECHRITGAGSQALLKIVEEPPDSTIFVFCTTEVHKVIDTIISRCQRYQVYKIPKSLIIDNILRISKLENIPIKQSVAEAIADVSDGSMRDAISILDQSSANMENIDADFILRSHGFISNEMLFKISSATAGGDLLSLIKDLEEMCSGGEKQVVSNIMTHFVKLLVAKVTGDKIYGKFYEEESRKFTEDHLFNIVNRLDRLSRNQNITNIIVPMTLINILFSEKITEKCRKNGYSISELANIIANKFEGKTVKTGLEPDVIAIETGGGNWLYIIDENSRFVNDSRFLKGKYYIVHPDDTIQLASSSENILDGLDLIEKGIIKGG